MSIALLVAGIGAILAGLGAILYGIPIKEFGFGNTLILTGAIGFCTGMMLLALWMVVAELKLIARRLAIPRVATEPRPRPSLPPLAAPPSQPSTEDSFAFNRDQPSPPEPRITPSAAPAAAPSWQEEMRERARPDASEAATGEAGSGGKPRRNLLFSSVSRKERERGVRPESETSGPRAQPGTPAETGETPPASFENAWPRPERARPPETLLPRRTGRVAPSFGGANPPASPPTEPPPEATPEQPPVTVLKSGVVDGMAYSLYSDGSIEAQMPEGMMRFASIDELRAHLDQR